MQIIRHPRSGTPIEGLRLGPGAKIKLTDMYDSTTGAWEPSPTRDLRIEWGCQTLWVRPGPPSGAARALLTDLVTHNLLLALRVNWGVISSISWRSNGSMDWVVDRAAVEELLGYAFVSRVVMTDSVYEPTNAGRRALVKEYDRDNDWMCNG